MTPLHCACYNGRLDIAQWLHGAGAAINATDINGATPLHLACFKGHLEIAQWLCSAGADVTLKDNAGSPPAQLFERHARTKLLNPQALRSTLARVLCGGRKPKVRAALPRGPARRKRSH